MNLLLDNTLWAYLSASFSAGTYFSDINGQFAAPPNGDINWNEPSEPPPASRVAGSVEWSIDFPPDSGEIWFLVLDGGVVVFAEPLYSGGPLSGSFSFNVAVNEAPRITTSGSSSDLFPGINSYDQLGFFQITPTPNPPTSTLVFTPQIDVEESGACYPPVCSCTLPAC